MYEEKEKTEKIKDNEKKVKKISFKADWVSIVIKLAILLAFAFLFIYVFTKLKGDSSEKIFDKNVEMMRAGAYTYFKEEENRPNSVDEEYDLTLQDMINSSLISELKDKKKNVCDKENSYASLTKESATKYNLHIYLLCNGDSKEKDYSVTYKETKTTTKDNKDTEEKKDEQVKENSSNNTSNENNNTTSDTSLTTIYEYKKQVRSAESYDCPDGFVLNGQYCYSESKLLTVDATPKYKVIPASNTAANYSAPKTEYEYANPIVTKSASTLYCDSGYQLVNGVCQKTINATASNKTNYSCTSGTLSGTNCIIKTKGTKVPATYSCNNGTLIGKSICRLTSSVKYRCTKGTYDKNKESCYVYVNANPLYTNWKLDNIYQYKTAPKNSNTITYEFAGVGSNGLSRYKRYTRTISGYDCPSGTYYKNGKCKVYKSSYLVKYCDSGYTLNGTETKCYVDTLAPIKTAATIKCPSGYTKVGNECQKTVKATKNISTTYKCPSGYQLNGKTCIKKVTAKTKSGSEIYTCPQGYTKTGTGGSTKCSKSKTTKSYYYCQDSAARLVNNRCVKDQIKEFVSYKCPSGYELSGDKCYKYTSTDKIKATKIDGEVIREETMWSAKKSVSGWERTGRSKKV